jgi:hypothetical protein
MSVRRESIADCGTLPRDGETCSGVLVGWLPLSLLGTLGSGRESSSTGSSLMPGRMEMRPAEGGGFRVSSTTPSVSENGVSPGGAFGAN